MLRKLLVSLLLIGLAAYSLGTSTMALFSDTETASGTFHVGTLDFHYRVSQDGGITWGAWQNGTSASFALPGLQRGQNGRVTYQIENTGSVDSLLDIRNAVVTDYENGCSSAEATVDTTCGDPGAGQGELGSNLLVTMMVGAAPVYSGALNGFIGNYNIHQLLAGGSTLEMTIDWYLPPLQGGSQCNDNDKPGNGYGHCNGQGQGHGQGNGQGHDRDCACSGADIIDSDSAAVSFKFELIQQ